MAGKRKAQTLEAPNGVATKEQEQLLEQQFLDERKILIEGEQESADQFDKNILTLAGGALGLSIIFIEKIAPSPLPTTLIYLYMGWGGLVGSLLVTLSSFLTSQHAYRRQIQILQEEMFPRLFVSTGSLNRWAKITRCLNWLSILGFIFGITMLVSFSIQNIRVSGQTKKETKPQTATIP